MTAAAGVTAGASAAWTTGVFDGVLDAAVFDVTWVCGVGVAPATWVASKMRR